MLDKTIAQDVPAGMQREEIIRNSCDAVEVLDYTKELSKERREELKETLVDKNVQLRDVKADKRKADEIYKEQDKAYKNQIKHLESENEEIAKILKEKAEFVSEECFKIIDEETKTVGYYDREGVLRYSRPARLEERQSTIQMEIRRTGTEG